MEFQFYKTEDDRWFIDLPEYPGPNSDLEMVRGADDFLNSLAVGDSSLCMDVCVYKRNFVYYKRKGYSKLKLKYSDEIGGNGAYYETDEELYEGVLRTIWLCDVVKYIFGNFPNTIYYKLK